MMMPQEYRKEYYKKYWERNKENINKRKREFRYKNPEHSMLQRVKYRSKIKELEFNLDIKYLKNIWPKDNRCPALGLSLQSGRNDAARGSSPSLDRINNTKGYVKGNVQVICNLANQIMTSATPEQVMLVAKYYEKITEGVDNEEKI